jgi:sodium/potassium/calcium exchanger 6
VVALIEASGLILGVSTSVLGLTLIAWGNSAGDLIANTTVAKGAEGDPKQGAKMALAACFGSPLLMNLIGTGGALTAHMAVSGGKPVAADISQNCRVAYFFLAIATASHVVVFPMSGYAPPKRYAFYLFGLYALFMIFLFCAEAGALGGFLM